MANDSRAFHAEHRDVILKPLDGMGGMGIFRVGDDGLNLGGVVMTMFDSRTKLAKQVVDEVKQHLPGKVFDSVIPRTVRLSEAPSFGKPIFAYDPSGPGAAEYSILLR